MFVRTATRFSRPSIRRATIALTVVALARSGQLLAQEAPSQAKTHTVKRGDTLWDLAKTYLGDPFLWPEIYRLNTDVVEDPHWIYPGEVLKLPGESARVVAAAPTPDMPLAAPQPEPERTAPTIFSQPAPIAVVSPGTSSAQEDRYPAVRWGEHLAAPWVDQRGGPSAYGRIIRSGSVSIHVESEQHEAFSLYDAIQFSAPDGASAMPRTRFLSYVLGPFMEEFGQIVIPTGVIEVTRPPQNGEAGVATVVQMFGPMTVNQRLVPFDSAAMNVYGNPTTVMNGRTGEIRWMFHQPLLPSTQQYLVLDMGQREGLRLGDRVQLFQPRTRARNEDEPDSPEIAIGDAQVVRVTSRGATALLTAVQQPKIQEGTAARVAAKMP